MTYQYILTVILSVTIYTYIKKLKKLLNEMEMILEKRIPYNMLGQILVTDKWLIS